MTLAQRALSADGEQKMPDEFGRLPTPSELKGSAGNLWVGGIAD
jgi:hypothetical protein